MKKQILIGMSVLSLCFSAFAGDAAVFVDGGFSKDGKVYVFGQYGKTDKRFEAYAELYTVRVAENDFIKGENFKTGPSAATVNKNGKDLYEQLCGKSYGTLKKYGLAPTSPDNVLYIRSDVQKKGTDEILFQDFEDGAVSYRVSLKPTVKKENGTVSSSFYIAVQKLDGNGTVTASYTVGSPKYWRKNVSGYCVDKIFKDAGGKSLVFVVEKTVEDATGKCIRYMVETITL